MTYLKIVTTLVTAGFIGGSLAASAGSVAEKFAAMDADANGAVSASEFVTYATSSSDHSATDAQAKFDALAGDDGALSLEELEAAYGEKTDEGVAEETTEDAGEDSADS